MKMTKQKIIAAAFCSVIGMATASAQWAVRADLGVMCYYSITPAESHVGIMPGFGAQVGADYDLHVKGTFYVTPGLYWSYRAAVSGNFSGSDLDSEFLQEHFLNVPLYAKWKFDIKPDKFGMYVYCGPTVSFCLASYSKLDMSASGYHITGTYDYLAKKADFGDGNMASILEYEIESYGLGLSWVDIRADLGVGFVFKRNNELVLGFDLGALDRTDNNLPEKSFMNSCNFYLGYRYRFGKKQQ